LGAPGSDFIDWVAQGDAVIDLSSGTVSGAPGPEALHSIEQAKGSLDNDTLIGNAAENFLSGGGVGDDHLEGRGGDDYLIGGEGTDFLDGGAGTDTCAGGETVLNCEALAPIPQP
jgi:Ca2+-binding RTX toxin-like protein